eukprot:229355-Chlamydomonas_euryale.AAC.3
MLLSMLAAFPFHLPLPNPVLRAPSPPPGCTSVPAPPRSPAAGESTPAFPSPPPPPLPPSSAPTLLPVCAAPPAAGGGKERAVEEGLDGLGAHWWRQ